MYAVARITPGLPVTRQDIFERCPSLETAAKVARDFGPNLQVVRMVDGHPGHLSKRESVIVNRVWGELITEHPHRLERPMDDDTVGLSE